MPLPSTIALRVFSGPHLGAELQLPYGSYVIGSEDSCDIIFVDANLLGRHAIMKIAPHTEEGTETLSVVISPLDGELLVNDEIVGAQGLGIALCTLFTLGSTSLAWNFVGEPWPDMSRVGRTPADSPDDSLDDGLGQVPETAEEIEKREAEAAAFDAAVLASAGLMQEAAEQDEQIDDEEKQESLRDKAHKIASLPLKTLLTFFLAVLCLCGVMISFEGRAPNMTVHAQELEAKLHAMGMKGLTVSLQGKTVLVQGSFANDKERADLWRLSQTLLYPLHIEAEVRDDIVRAVASAFNSRYLYPEVLPVYAGALPAAQESSAEGQNESVSSATSQKTDKVIQILGYFQDGQVEAWAFQAMHEDVPTPFTALRTVRHQKDVEALLGPALEKAKLQHVRVRFMPGLVQLAGHFDMDQHKALDDVLITVQDTLGVPVRFEVYADLPQSIQVAAATNTSDSRALEDKNKKAKAEGSLSAHVEAVKPLGDLRVVGVTLGPLRFFSTEDGQRFFEGAILPSGYTVERITTAALTLEKDGNAIEHALRGDHE